MEEVAHPLRMLMVQGTLLSDQSGVSQAESPLANKMRDLKKLKT